jgi:hypothetical protein
VSAIRLLRLQKWSAAAASPELLRAIRQSSDVPDGEELGDRFELVFSPANARIAWIDAPAASLWRLFGHRFVPE